MRPKIGQSNWGPALIEDLNDIEALARQAKRLAVFAVVNGLVGFAINAVLVILMVLR